MKSLNKLYDTIDSNIIAVNIKEKRKRKEKKEIEKYLSYISIDNIYVLWYMLT